MKKLLAGLLVFVAVTSTAEELGSVVTVSGESPQVVPFLRCRALMRESGTDERPTVCRERESKLTFNAKAARVTNLGDTVAWLHVGEDKVPLLPRTTVTVGAMDRAFTRLFLSVDEGETARVHVFASDQITLDRAYIHPEPEKPRR